MNNLEENFIKETQTHFKCSLHSAIKIAKYTEQECVGFAEWVISQEEYEGDYTVEQLFKLYLKSKENGSKRIL